MRILFITGLLLFCLFAQAQSDNTELIIDQEKCDSTEMEALSLIPYYFKNEQPKNVLKKIENWQKSCGTNELLCATYAFFDLLSGAFEEDSPPKDLLHCLSDYASLDTLTYKTEHLAKLLLYKAFIKENAQNMDTAGLNQDEKFIRAFFAEEADFQSLLALYPKAVISKDYNQAVEIYANEPDVRWGGYLGGYVPLGNNKIFGNHATIGFNINIINKKHLFGIEADLKLGKSKEEYEVDGEKHKGFNAALINVFYGQRILHKKSHSLFARGGIGGDFITVFPSEDTDGDGETDTEAKYLNSFSINFGTQYQYTNSSGISILPGIFYNITNFHNSGGTNVKGNYLTIRLMLLMSLSPERHRILSKLR